jgi:transcriptional regulator with XRE-family HTH domain
MSKRKPMDKEQARERRNQLLESAAAAELSLTDGVREMRAIAGMTQEEFARHRGVSARVIKAIELGQGNPTVATLNRIGQFFGLEVAFVPVKRVTVNVETMQPTDDLRREEKLRELADVTGLDAIRKAVAARESMIDTIRQLSEALDTLDERLDVVQQRRPKAERTAGPLSATTTAAKSVQSRKKNPRAD